MTETPLHFRPAVGAGVLRWVALQGRRVKVRRLKKPVTYFVFVLTVTLFFLYICFPAQTVREYLEASAGRFAPAFSLKILDVLPDLPMGLRLNQARLSYKDEPAIPLFKADTFVIMPSIRIVTSGRPVVRFDCQAYGGRMEGVIAFESLDFKGPLRFKVELAGIQLGQYQLIKKRLGRECSGVVGGSLQFAFDGTNPFNGSGKGDISVTNGSVEFAEPFLGMTSVKFSQAHAQVVFEKRQLSVSGLNFEGSQINGAGKGTIVIDRDFARSNLDLTVAISPAPGFRRNGQEGTADAARLFLKRLEENPFAVRIRGTISQPRISFL
jgi:type II secretion system protein N